MHIDCSILSLFTVHAVFIHRESERRIGDLMKKNAPFLKLYTAYIKNFDNAMSLINHWLEKSPKFAAIIQEIQVTTSQSELCLCVCVCACMHANAHVGKMRQDDYSVVLLKK